MNDFNILLEGCRLYIWTVCHHLETSIHTKNNLSNDYFPHGYCIQLTFCLLLLIQLSWLCCLQIKDSRILPVMVLTNERGDKKRGSGGVASRLFLWAGIFLELTHLQRSCKLQVCQLQPVCVACSKIPLIHKWTLVSKLICTCSLMGGHLNGGGRRGWGVIQGSAFKSSSWVLFKYWRQITSCASYCFWEVKEKLIIPALKWMRSRGCYSYYTRHTALHN